MKKIKLFTAMILLVAITLTVTASATDSDPPGKLKPPREEYLVPVEYDHTELSPKEAEILKDVKGTFFVKMLCFQYRYTISNGWPIEEAVNYVEYSGDQGDAKWYVFISEEGDGFDYYNVKKGELVCQNRYATEVWDPSPILKTVFREDLFQSVSLTENLDDLQIIDTYCFYSGGGKSADMIYFKTNHGDFIWGLNVYDFVPTGEFLFPKDLFYEYEGDIWKMLEKIEDLTPYEVRVPSATLPPPYTADPSALFAAMAILSAARFTLFAVNKKIKTV